jgi:hypothetical protein
MSFVRLLAALAAIACADAAAQQPARAVDPGYVLNVPVTITKLGPGHRVEVACSIHQGQPGSQFQKSGGESHQTVPVPLDKAGNYSGTITVKMPTPSGTVAPNHYQCVLLFDGGNNIPPHATVNRPTWMSSGSF